MHILFLWLKNLTHKHFKHIQNTGSNFLTDWEYYFEYLLNKEISRVLDWKVMINWLIYKLWVIIPQQGLDLSVDLGWERDFDMLTFKIQMGIVLFPHSLLL